jgi:hypothetical protein
MRTPDRDAWLRKLGVKATPAEEDEEDHDYLGTFKQTAAATAKESGPNVKQSAARSRELGQHHPPPVRGRIAESDPRAAAYQAGYQDGLAGEPMPYNKDNFGPRGVEAYERGFADGRAELQKRAERRWEAEPSEKLFEAKDLTEEKAEESRKTFEDAKELHRGKREWFGYPDEHDPHVDPPEHDPTRPTEDNNRGFEKDPRPFRPWIPPPPGPLRQPLPPFADAVQTAEPVASAAAPAAEAAVSAAVQVAETVASTVTEAAVESVASAPAQVAEKVFSAVAESVSGGDATE